MTKRIVFLLGLFSGDKMVYYKKIKKFNNKNDFKDVMMKAGGLLDDGGFTFTTTTKSSCFITSIID